MRPASVFPFIQLSNFREYRHEDTGMKERTLTGSAKYVTLYKVKYSSEGVAGASVCAASQHTDRRRSGLS